MSKKIIFGIGVLVILALASFAAIVAGKTYLYSPLKSGSCTGGFDCLPTIYMDGVHPRVKAPLIQPGGGRWLDECYNCFLAAADEIKKIPPEALTECINQVQIDLTKPGDADDKAKGLEECLKSKICFASADMSSCMDAVRKMVAQVKSANNEVSNNNFACTKETVNSDCGYPTLESSQTMDCSNAFPNVQGMNECPKYVTNVCKETTCPKWYEFWKSCTYECKPTTTESTAYCKDCQGIKSLEQCYNLNVGFNGNTVYSCQEGCPPERQVIEDSCHQFQNNPSCNNGKVCCSNLPVTPCQDSSSNSAILPSNECNNKIQEYAKDPKFEHKFWGECSSVCDTLTNCDPSKDNCIINGAKFMHRWAFDNCNDGQKCCAYQLEELRTT